MPSDPANDAAIVTTDLVRTFGRNRAVDGIDLQVETGEIYGFLGPNGAGKSTTVKMLCTLLSPTSGTATVAGHDVETASGEVRLRIGVALQDASIDPKQTGRELLELQGRLYGLSATDRRRRMDDLIGLVDIGDAIDRRVEGYSGGMRRRLDLAMSLIHRPQILFLDEPTTGLDPMSRAAVWDEVRTLNRRDGVTIFLTTQYLEEADALADRVGIITGGRIEAEGTPAELKRTIGEDLVAVTVSGDREDVARAADAVRAVPGVDRVDVHGNELAVATPSGAHVVAAVVVALDGCRVDIDTLTLRSPTLDDVFLDVTGRTLTDSADATDTPGGTEGSPT